jgi:ring-1,2-phenylacetyl-CoA epoxidase subunit PaaD
MAAIADVPDPEIPAVSLIDLGIVRGLQADPPALLVTPTYTGCPATLVIELSLREALDKAGFVDLPIKTVLSPAWTTDWITERGRQDLHAYGIAPPPRGAASRSLRGMQFVECPRCGSAETVEVSRFGSTPCKAQWRCRACLEPFDRFKCH